MPAYKNNGTWREQQVTLQPSQPETIYFNDTMPNYIQISNSSPNPLYIGVNGSVNSTSYDMVIPAYATRLYARMGGTSRLYLYSDAAEALSIQVSSWEDEFNPAAIAQSVELVGSGENGLLGIVEINNILSSLPAGDNVIGGVIIADYAAQLPTGNNKIGRVELDAGTQKIGKVDVDTLPARVGANYQKVTASTASDIVVKSAPGTVFSVQGADLYDGNTHAWADGFNNAIGLKCVTNITLHFAAAGDAFILYE